LKSAYIDKENFVAVRIRMKKMGRRHRPFFRICAMDSRAPRDGKVIEELGHYDPMVADTDARATLKSERIDYWLSVGARPSDNVRVLIKKYGTEGTHLDQQRAAQERLKTLKPHAPPPMRVPQPKAETPPETTDPAPAETAEGDPSAAAPSSDTPSDDAPPTSEGNDQ